MAIGGYTTGILISDQGLQIAGHTFSNDLKDVWTIPIAGRRRRRRRLPVRAAGAAAVGALPRARHVRDRGLGAGGVQEVRDVHRRRHRHQPLRHQGADRLDLGRPRLRPQARLLRLALLPLLDDRARPVGRRLAPAPRPDRACVPGGARQRDRRRRRPASASRPTRRWPSPSAPPTRGSPGRCSRSRTRTSIRTRSRSRSRSSCSSASSSAASGSLSGLVVGAVLVQFLPLWSQEISKSPGAPAVVYGVVLIAIMLALPGGVAGLLRRVLPLARRLYTRSR